ncbi:hypothetical protein Cni_G01143 [Canna indica]|uniref:Uncharacterized protein n=1 Tax=Canna indica TaxID=4628 RepID=A0AAQ3Q1F1_9LILI|nr:hypothetical protein Cni_G01143 [Canna indica]
MSYWREKGEDIHVIALVVNLSFEHAEELHTSVVFRFKTRVNDMKTIVSIDRGIQDTPALLQRYIQIFFNYYANKREISRKGTSEMSVSMPACMPLLCSYSRILKLKVYACACVDCKFHGAYGDGPVHSCCRTWERIRTQKRRRTREELMCPHHHNIARGKPSFFLFPEAASLKNA